MPRIVRDWLDLLPPLVRSRALAMARALTSARRCARPSWCITDASRRCSLIRKIVTASVCSPPPAIASSSLRRPSCCGALDLHSGNACARSRFRARQRSRAQELAAPTRSFRRRRDARWQSPNTATCSKTIRTSPTMRARFPSKVRDLSSLLLDAPANLMREFRCRITYHDACHLAHGLGVREAPRKLLASIPGVTTDRDAGVRSLLRLRRLLQSDRAGDGARPGAAQSRQHRRDRRRLRRAGEPRMRVSDRRRTSPSRRKNQGRPPGRFPRDGVSSEASRNQVLLRIHESVLVPCDAARLRPRGFTSACAYVSFLMA